jgi:hypothetical protein
MDGDSGGAGLAEGEGGVTLIELLLDVLFAAAHSKNAAKVRLALKRDGPCLIRALAFTLLGLRLGLGLVSHWS